MPIFEYACKGCGEEFEHLLQGTAGASCPSCDGTELEKKLSSFAVSNPAPVLAGGGPCGSCGDPRGAGACGLD